MSEQIEHRSPNWHEKPEITVGMVINLGIEKYFTAEDAAYFPDNVRDTVALLAYYIGQAGDDPEVVLKRMGLFKLLPKTE